MTIIPIEGENGRLSTTVDSRWEILHTTERSQVAVMILAPGQASSASPSVHPDQDQILYLTEGELYAEVGSETGRLYSGQLVVVTAGTPHRFVNTGSVPARTLNIYSPPAYGSPGA